MKRGAAVTISTAPFATHPVCETAQLMMFDGPVIKPPRPRTNEHGSGQTGA